MANNMYKSNKTPTTSYHLLRFIGASLLIILFGSALTFLWGEQDHQPLPPYATHPNTVPNYDSTMMLHSTQILLITLGLSVVILLIIPGLLIRKKRSLPVPHTIEITRPDQTRPNQLMTETLPLKAATTEQLQPIFLGQVSPISKHLVSTAASSRQVDIQRDPSSELSPQDQQPPQAASTQNASIRTPFQRVPATPFIQHVPPTPLIPRSSQGGLLTRYNVTGGLPRRIELRYAQQNTNPRQNVPRASRATSQRREGHISQ